MCYLAECEVERCWVNMILELLALHHSQHGMRYAAATNMHTYGHFFLWCISLFFLFLVLYLSQSHLSYLIHFSRGLTDTKLADSNQRMDFIRKLLPCNNKCSLAQLAEHLSLFLALLYLSYPHKFCVSLPLSLSFLCRFSSFSNGFYPQIFTCCSRCNIVTQLQCTIRD